jgi:Flp pilus assembly protein TadD
MQSVSQASSRTAVSTVMARQARNAIDAGEGDLQVRALRQRLAANAQDLDARVLLARWYARRGLPDLALEHYRLASAQFPDAAVVALGLARTLREMGAKEEALKSVQAFLDRHPSWGDWELLAFQGVLLDEMGRLAEAARTHRAALELAPQRASLHNNLGYNLLLQRSPAEAEAEFRRALEIDPRSAIARNNLGTALAAQSRIAQAREEWQRSGDGAAAHNNLAAALIEQGRHAEARAELAAALAMRRDFPQALANLRLLEERAGGSGAVTAAGDRVNFWKRLASTLRIGSGAKPGRDTAVAGTGGAGGTGAGRDHAAE